ncbi:MAG: RNA polymerase sigma factor RpoD/SigA [Spirochaetales bacterium]|nr:RNA polymerase sigma factor RpoD/SigA [Spirochaetales bacterium]
MSNYKNDESTLSTYLKEINKVDLLTREEEDEIARRAVSGDPMAKDILVSANLRFVVNVAKKYQNQGLTLEDLIGEGNLGLINAIEKYDPERGYHFISYAVWWIRQAILKAICEKSRMIRLPMNRANELVQIEKTRKELTNSNGEEPEIAEIARELDLKAKDVEDLLRLSRDHVSLETPVFYKKDSSVLGDFIEDEGYLSPDDQVMNITLKEDINKVLLDLPTKEAQVLQYRYGLNDKKPMSLKEIGDIYDLTKERIRQIEQKALIKLQHPGRKRKLEAYVA